MLKLFLVGLGGAIGAVLRYLIGGLDYRFSGGVFPVSTLVVNVTGSFAIGFLWGLVDRFTFSPGTRLFLFMGILGGYTTFSTFSLETFNLVRDGEYRIAMVNTLASFTLGIAAVFLGYFLSRALLNLYR